MEPLDTSPIPDEMKAYAKTHTGRCEGGSALVWATEVAGSASAAGAELGGAGVAMPVPSSRGLHGLSVQGRGRHLWPWPSRTE